MIWLNFVRDLRSTVSRMISVVFITVIAVLVYVALGGITHNVQVFCHRYYETHNTADYWITGSGLNMADCRTLANMEGITAVQPRISLEAQEKGDSSVTLQLYAAPAPYTINIPYLTAGQLPASHREMAISDMFARAHGLSIGDWYEMTVPGTGYVLRLQISGLIKSAELQRHVNATTPTTDLSRYGFAYLNDKALEPLLGPNTYTQICLTAAEGTSDESLRRQIDTALGDRAVSVMSLEDNFAAFSFQGTTNDLQPVLNIFPILFFLCAILLMVSNMSRLIEGARQDIGTFKALGYQDSTIMGYYLLYAVLIVLLGLPIGILPSKPLIRLIVDTLATGCDLPDFPIIHDYGAWIEVFVITTLCCVGSAFLVARSSLKETPAQCMRPKPPRNTKPVFLERLSRLWRRLSFNQKYIIRNTLRNKARMLTCVVGIAFCMALVVAAFGLRDAIGHYAEALTSNQNRYDIIAQFSGGVTESQYRRLSHLDSAEAVEYEMTTACWLYSPRQLTTAALQVTEDRPALRLYDPYATSTSAMPTDGMVLEEALAQKLGVAEGDVVTVRFPGEFHTYALRVAEVNRCVSGTYVGRSCWRSLGRAYTPTAAYLLTDNRAQLTAELDNYDFVSGWQTRDAVTNAAAESLTSASMVAYILIVFGGGLACVVIYNLGIMSFFEQIRNLATLMVLGFFDHEIRKLQLSENIIFAALGVLLGLPAGVALTGFFIVVLDDIPLTMSTTPTSYLLSCAITLLFALLVNGIIGRKMREIDMLGALKSVE